MLIQLIHGSHTRLGVDFGIEDLALAVMHGIDDQIRVGVEDIELLGTDVLEARQSQTSTESEACRRHVVVREIQSMFQSLARHRR